jgi:hypothetical protein
VVPCGARFGAPVLIDRDVPDYLDTLVAMEPFVAHPEAMRWATLLSTGVRLRTDQTEQARSTCPIRSGPAPQRKQRHMTDNHNAVIAVFDDHPSAEAAVKKLADAGIDIKHLSVVGKGYHTDEKVVGFYNTGDRVKFWGKRGAFWGGLWGWLFGGVFMFIPVVGHVVVLGYLATMAISAIEGAAVVGGLSALGAALYGSGIPKDSVLAYETAVKADGFLVTAHGPAEEVARAKAILVGLGASRVDLHETAAAPDSATPVS